MGTMNRSINKSIYDQSDMLIDLLEKHGMVDRVMSLRPILTKATVILACQLNQPSLGSKDVEDMMMNILLGKDSVQVQLFASIFDYKDSILTAFHQQSLSYLQENSFYYKNTKNAKGNLSSNLVPEIGDFVA